MLCKWVCDSVGSASERRWRVPGDRPPHWADSGAAEKEKRVLLADKAGVGNPLISEAVEPLWSWSAMYP